MYASGREFNSSITLRGDQSMDDSNKKKPWWRAQVPWWVLLTALIIGDSISIALVYVISHPLYGNIYLTIGAVSLILAVFLSGGVLREVYRFRHPTQILTETIGKHKFILPLFFVFPLYFVVTFYMLAAVFFIKSRNSPFIVGRFLTDITFDFYYLVLIPTVFWLVMSAIIFFVVKKERSSSQLSSK